VNKALLYNTETENKSQTKPVADRLCDEFHSGGVVSAFDGIVFLEGLVIAGCIERGRIVDADVAEVPGFKGVARDVLLALGIAHDEAVFMGVRGQPDAAGILREALVQRGIGAAGDVRGQSGLMVGIARPRADRVGGGGTVLGDIVVVKLVLVFIGAVGGGQHQLDAVLGGAGEHLRHRLRRFPAQGVRRDGPVDRDIGQIRRNISVRQLVLLVGAQQQAVRIAELGIVRGGGRGRLRRGGSAGNGGCSLHRCGGRVRQAGEQGAVAVKTGIERNSRQRKQQNQQCDQIAFHANNCTTKTAVLRTAVHPPGKSAQHHAERAQIG